MEDQATPALVATRVIRVFRVPRAGRDTRETRVRWVLKARPALQDHLAPGVFKGNPVSPAHVAVLASLVRPAQTEPTETTVLRAITAGLDLLATRENPDSVAPRARAETAVPPVFRADEVHAVKRDPKGLRAFRARVVSMRDAHRHEDGMSTIDATPQSIVLTCLDVMTLKYTRATLRRIKALRRVCHRGTPILGFTHHIGRASHAHNTDYNTTEPTSGSLAVQISSEKGRE